MIEKMKMLISKIKTRIFYNRCYDKMEEMSIAVFGMCEGAVKFGIFDGAYIEKYRKEKCSSCPYFREKDGEHDD